MHSQSPWLLQSISFDPSALHLQISEIVNKQLKYVKTLDKKALKKKILKNRNVYVPTKIKLYVPLQFGNPKWSGLHLVHLSPTTPYLQGHFPVLLSQFWFSDPSTSHSHSVNWWIIWEIISLIITYSIII